MDIVFLPKGNMVMTGGGYGSFRGRGRGRRGGKKKKATTKAKKDNWFEYLKVDQLKAICKAGKLRHVGNKPDLVSRLLDNKATKVFAFEKKRGPRTATSTIGVGLEDIKDMCRKRHLQVSGTRLELVLRVLYHDHDSAPEGVVVKRSATEIETVVDEETGETKEVAVARKRAKTGTTTARKPNYQVVYNKIKRKIESAKQKIYQTHYGSKCHSRDVYSLLEKVIQEECIDKNYIESDPIFALNIAKAAFVSLKDNFHLMPMPGYDMDDDFLSAAEHFKSIAEEAMEHLTQEEKIQTAVWIEECDALVEPYGMGGWAKEDRPLLQVAAMLRDGDNDKVSSQQAEKEVRVSTVAKHDNAEI